MSGTAARQGASSSPASRPITVLLADDHAVVRKGTRDFLEEDPEIDVIAEAADGAEAWQSLTQRQPNVAVLDVRMPEINGIDLTRRIKQQYPSVRVLILTAYDDDPYIFAALRAGAEGFLLKTAPSSDLLRAVKELADGKSFLDTTVAPRVFAHLSGARQVEVLSERELEVLQGVAKGWTNREIANFLSISNRTVQGHLANIFGKLQVTSRTEAVTVALQQGILTLSDTQA
ncbi:MAG: response regulator transcription factor [Caldilineaceae bacterium]|nr:response regulator transcription factor [Caldilineaceae bacterium]